MTFAPRVFQRNLTNKMGLFPFFNNERVRVGATTMMNRRSFLTRFAATGASSAVLFNDDHVFGIDELPPGVVPSNPRELLYPTPEPRSKVFAPESGAYAASFPILQNIDETSASVVWALNAPSTGWVEWGPTPNLGKVARDSEFGLNPFESDFLSARITGLSPNTTYYYRTATCAFNYKSAYDKSCSAPQYSEVYSFKTVGVNVDSFSFAVINDTHNVIETVAKLFSRVEEINPDMLVWNGDLCHRYPSSLIVKTGIANPCDTPYASRRPLILARGNHDRWGPFAHKFNQIFKPWIQPNPRFRSLGYNVALRCGPLAFVTLDTAEIKEDSSKGFQGISNAEPYRELQAAWLESVLQRPDIASAPYLVAFCHIPLFNHTAEDGEGIIPGVKWPAFHALSAKYWGPILDKFGVQLMISAHRHKFAYSPADNNRPWAQLLGGGPLMTNATCIYADANKDRLAVTCEKLEDGSRLGRWEFKPRF